MTDEVGRLVLADNDDQNDLMGTSRANAASLLPVHARQIKDFGRDARAQPRTGGAAVGEGDPAAHRGRDRSDVTGTGDADGARQAGRSRTRCWPASCPTRRCSPPGCRAYFPAQLREQFGTDIRSHQLRREIVTTMLVNDLVDTGGISYAYRVTEDVGVGPVDAVRSYVATDAIFRIGEVWRQIRAAGETACRWRCPTG